MPKHNNLDIYPFDPSIDARDGVFGFDYNTGGKSKNFKMEHLRYFILEGLDPSNNGFVTTTGYTLVDNVLTINAGWQWQINGMLFTNEEDIVFTLEYTAEGFVRIDSIYANSNNELLLTSGGESETIAVPPQIPINTLLAFSINIFDTTIVAEEEPVIGNIYQQKQFDYLQTYTGTGTDVVIPLNTTGHSHIQLKGTMTSVAGLSFADLVANPVNAEYPHYGKRYLFFNDSGHDIILKHFAGTEDIFFTFKEETDLVFPNGEFLEFYNGSNVFINVFRSWKDINSISGLPEILDLKADLVSGKVPAIQLPSYVDDVLEFTNLAGFPATGEAGKIYLALDTNFTYRWTGSVYVKISDTGKLDKVTSTGVERFYKINPDGSQGTKPVSDILAGEINLPAYTSARNDGANPNNKVLNVDASGNLKLYTMAVMPPPYLEELIPDSYMPSTTGNFIIKGSFFTPSTTVSVEGQTLNYLNFISDNEMLANLTTGATEGTFDVTINNGVSVVFPDALLIVSGEVFEPVEADWINTSIIDVSEAGSAKVTAFGSAGSTAEWTKQLDYTKDWTLKFNVAESPLGTMPLGMIQTALRLKSLDGASTLFSFAIYKHGSGYLNYWAFIDDHWAYSAIPFGANFSDSLINNFELRYISGVMYVYVTGVLKITFPTVLTQNIKLIVTPQYYDLMNIKYIEHL